MGCVNEREVCVLKWANKLWADKGRLPFISKKWDLLRQRLRLSQLWDHKADCPGFTIDYARRRAPLLLKQDSMTASRQLP